MNIRKKGNPRLYSQVNDGGSMFSIKNWVSIPLSRTANQTIQ